MINVLVKDLAQYARLENSIDVERFDAILSRIADLNDPQTVALLLPVFNDQCKFPEAMFSIIHTIERFDDTTYAREILLGLPKLLAKSPYWASVLHYRILNSPETRMAYQIQLADTNNEIKAACKKLLTHIRDTKPKFKGPCDELLAVI